MQAARPRQLLKRSYRKATKTPISFKPPSVYGAFFRTKRPESAKQTKTKKKKSFDVPKKNAKISDYNVKALARFKTTNKISRSICIKSAPLRVLRDA